MLNYCNACMCIVMYMYMCLSRCKMTVCAHYIYLLAAAMLMCTPWLQNQHPRIYTIIA